MLRTVSTGTASLPVEASQPGKGRRWTPWVLALVAVLVVGGVLAGVLLSRGPENESSTQQLAALQRACAQWRTTTGADQMTPTDWCTNMIGWMSDRMDDHPGMWATPEAMRATCQEWSSSNATSVSEGDRIAWCDEMVTWMQQHAAQWGSWNGWMMHGPMMGG
jgi:hypothetical protein